jgi:hypothetical protein
VTDEPSADTSARQLYGTAPSEFVPARDAEARRLRDAGHPLVAKQVKALRRPSIAAALVDAVVRQEPDLVGQVVDVGRRLRAASGDAGAGPAEHRALDDDRRAVVRRCVQAASEVADGWGSSATAASLREVEQTFWAAAVDAGALAAVRAGCLVRTLSPSGFGAVDTEGASAIEVVVEDDPVPRQTRRHSPTARRAPPRDDHALLEARRALREAEHSLREAEDEADAVGHRAAEAEERASRLGTELAELRRRVAAVEDELRDASADKRRGAAEKKDAERLRRAASSRIDRARRALESLDDNR